MIEKTLNTLVSEFYPTFSFLNNDVVVSTLSEPFIFFRKLFQYPFFVFDDEFYPLFRPKHGTRRTQDVIFFLLFSLGGLVEQKWTITLDLDLFDSKFDDVFLGYQVTIHHEISPVN